MDIDTFAKLILITFFITIIIGAYKVLKTFKNLIFGKQPPADKQPAKSSPKPSKPAKTVVKKENPETTGPDKVYKVNKKAIEKYLAMRKMEKEVNRGMHNLTGKFHKK